MTRTNYLKLLKLFCLLVLSWASASWAFSLGAPQVQSLVGEPLRVEIPIRISPEDLALLSSLSVDMPNRATYERLGIPQRIIDLNPQAMIYRNRQEELMVLIETVNPVPLIEDPFINVLLNLSWSSGSLTKAFTFLLADPQKVFVKPGQTLSEIAVNMLPQMEGATLDQTIMALFKANPDAFASGNINLLSAGVELNKPSQALLRSISPDEATALVSEANQQWRSERESSVQVVAKPEVEKSTVKDSAQKDTLKIGSSIEEGKDLERQYLEQLVAEEKELESTKTRIASLEKNIAELQRLIDQSKGQHQNQLTGKFTWLSKAIAIGAIALFVVLLAWIMIRNLRKTEITSQQSPSFNVDVSTDVGKGYAGSDYNMPERAKALFAGLNLDLSTPNLSPADHVPAVTSEPGPLADTLRVKLNLARAYITIEDFAAAKKALEEVLKLSNTVDPTITIEAQGILAELSHRQS